MALSKQKAASNRVYQAKLDVLKIQPHKAEGAAIRAAAAAAGQSVQAWLLQAARDGVAREEEKAPLSADKDGRAPPSWNPTGVSPLFFGLY